MNRLQKSGWKSDLPWLRSSYPKSMFIDFFTMCTYIGLPVVFTSEWKVFWRLIFEDVVQSSFKYVSLWCLLFDPRWTTYQSNTWIYKKTNHLRNHLPYKLMTILHVSSRLVRTNGFLVVMVGNLKSWSRITHINFRTLWSHNIVESRVSGFFY